MRWYLAFLALALLATANAGAPVPPAPANRAGDRDFVDLAALSRTNGFRFSWDRASRDVVLTNNSTRLVFTANARQLELNGVKVFLSVPVVARGTNALISRLDLRTLLQPLLHPARNKPGRKVRVIALDPGHGGKDKGYDTGERQEKHHTLLLASRLRALLQTEGFKVVLTRSGDTFVDLEKRPALAQRNRADLFISLHYNSAGNGNATATANGVETYCVTPAGATSTNARQDENSSTKAVPGNMQNARSVLLAYEIHRAILNRLEVEDRGLRRARFAVFRAAEMPAVLIEGGFLSDRDEGRELAGSERRRDLAQAIAEAVLAYKRLVERP